MSKKITIFKVKIKQIHLNEIEFSISTNEAYKDWDKIFGKLSFKEFSEFCQRLIAFVYIEKVPTVSEINILWSLRLNIFDGDSTNAKSIFMSANAKSLLKISTKKNAKIKKSRNKTL